MNEGMGFIMFISSIALFLLIMIFLGIGKVEAYTVNCYYNQETDAVRCHSGEIDGPQRENYKN